MRQRVVRLVVHRGDLAALEQVGMLPGGGVCMCACKHEVCVCMCALIMQVQLRRGGESRASRSGWCGSSALASITLINSSEGLRKRPLLKMHHNEADNHCTRGKGNEQVAKNNSSKQSTWLLRRPVM